MVAKLLLLVSAISSLRIGTGGTNNEIQSLKLLKQQVIIYL